MAIDAHEENLASGDYATETTGVVYDEAGYGGAVLKAIPAQNVNPSKVKSSSNSQSQGTEIKFSNRLGFPVIVYWIDFQGYRTNHFELDPRQSKNRMTTVGHVWLITDRDGKALAYFIARKLRNGHPGLAEITRGNISAN